MMISTHMALVKFCIKHLRVSLLGYLVVFKPGARRWFLEIAFVHEVGMSVCVSAPKAINYIHVVLNLYNQLSKFVAFINVTKLSMHGHWPL